MRGLPVVVAVVAVFAGLAIGSIYYSSVLGESEQRYQRLLDELRAENNRLQSQLSQANNQISQLQSNIKSIQTLLETVEQRAGQYSERIGVLEKRLESLTNEQTSLRSELQSLRTKTEQVKNVLSLLENDRVLLSWIRSGPPDERETARQYWNETRSLVAKSDPGLVSSVDKVLAALDLYFDWLDQFPPLTDVSQEALNRWCPLYINWLLNAPPGVDEYSNSIEQLNQEIMLVVIGHIDSLSRVFED